MGGDRMTVKMFDKIRTKSGKIGYNEIDLEPYDKNRDFPTETIKKEDVIEVVQ